MTCKQLSNSGGLSKCSGLAGLLSKHKPVSSDQLSTITALQLWMGTTNRTYAKMSDR